MFELRPAEWAAVALVVTAVVFVNELIIGDDGNTWIGLLLVSFWLGLGLVHLTRWVAHRRAAS